MPKKATKNETKTKKTSKSKATASGSKSASKGTPKTSTTKTSKSTSKDHKKRLVIVESPTKAKTLTRILPKEDYIIEASMGHIRDLPKSGLAIDVEHNFAPEYVIPDKAKKTVTKLKKALAEVDEVILSTDPDREGEAIAWHLEHILKSVKKYSDLKYSRVTFHELTKDAVLHAFEEPGELQQHLVDAQQARRVLDRLVGYKLSPLLWKKVRFGLSAGRVQSVAVRLIVEKERERDAFVPDEYWSVLVDLHSHKNTEKALTAELDKKDDEKLKITNEEQATKIVSDLENSTYSVKEIKKSERRKKSNAPLKTSTLQQTMANVYGMSAAKTMRAAQKLFENGLITYHRTDSLNLSPEFVNAARDFAKKEFGATYIPEKPAEYKTSEKNAQEAHEAIRPTDLTLLPANLKKNVADDSKKVYTIIWKRALESQMTDAVYDQTSLKVGTDTGYELKASGSVVKFAGWLAVADLIGFSSDKEDIHILAEFDEGESLDKDNIAPTQHFTQPPARYSDASLIKKLEELGIGRPSTYAPTLQTIKSRGYVEKDGRYYFPQDVAYVVSDILVEHFPTISDYEFTAGLENHLDEIAEGKHKWQPFIKEFYEPFEKRLDEADGALNKHDVTNLGPADETCPECGKPMIYKLGKFGKFLSCSDYPTCQYAQPLMEDVPVDADGNEITDFGKCDQCNDGVFVLRQGRYGKFLACSNYPKCKNAKPYLDKIGMTCPKCNEGEIVKKKAKSREFFGCSRYPDCDYASWKDPREVKAVEDDE